MNAKHDPQVIPITYDKHNTFELVAYLARAS